jgi:uncharacterized protein YndB with AHSA1/START domain
MIRAAKSAVIRRSVEDVFAYVSDQTNAVQWQAGIVEVQRLTDGPVGVGSRHRIVRTFMGRRLAVENEYVTFEPGRMVVFRTTAGPMPLEASYLVEPDEGGARVTSRIEMDASGFMSLAEPLIAIGLRREMDAAFSELKTLLEASAPTGSPETAAP